jgi:hypothetical protein
MTRARTAVLLAAAGLVSAQPSAFVSAGASYGFPAPLYTAPGQMMTVFVQLIDVPPYPFQRNSSGQLQPVRAAGTPWPTSLAGFSVSFQQGVTVYAAPILEVGPAPSGANTAEPGNILAAVTFQVPLEICRAAPPCPVVPPVTFGLSQSGQPGGGMDIVLVGDQVHVVTACDNFISSDDNYTSPMNYTGLPWGLSFGHPSPIYSCPGLAAHADGSLVSQANPAKTGEELVLYAVGLGQTSPPQQTGKPAAAAAATITPVALDFNYRSNALATKPGPTAPEPLFAGATQGFVGLYQVNFVVPPPPPGTPACQPYDGNTPINANLVYSNLTVSVGGAYSFDGTGICVAVPGD